MRVTIAAIGRDRRSPTSDLCAEYAKRMSWALTIHEVEPKKRLDGPALAAHEAELLLSKVPDGSVLVVLDERGRDLTSPEFAAVLEKWRDDGRNEVAFVIGGAAGLDPALRAKAEMALGFGRQTWPHLMVRAMLVEQIYRAETILAGHPYHKA